MAVRFSAQMSSQIAGQKRSVFLGAFACQTHQRRRGEVGHVADHGDQLIVSFGAQRDDFGTERCDHRGHLGEHRVVAAGAWGQYPHGSLEQVALRTIQSVEFGTSHRVPADEPGVGRSSTDGRFHTSDVRDGAAGFDQRPLDLIGCRQHRDGHKGDLGVDVEAQRVDDTATEGRVGGGPVDVVTAHVPTLASQAQRHRTPDQAQPDDVGAARRRRTVSHGSIVPATSRAGAALATASATDAVNARHSSVVSSRHDPGCNERSLIGPTRVRTSRVT